MDGQTDKIAGVGKIKLPIDPIYMYMHVCDKFYKSLFLFNFNLH